MSGNNPLVYHAVQTVPASDEYQMGTVEFNSLDNAIKSVKELIKEYKPKPEIK